MPLADMTEIALSERSEWAENWPLVLCCLFGVAVPLAAVYALGQFLGPLEKEFGWTRTQASAGLSISLVLGFFAGPLVGRIVDRTNARLLVLPGLCLVGIALASFALASRSSTLWIALWCLHAFAAAVVSPTVWIAIISAAFDKQRSMAIAVVLCGSGIASGLAPLSARYLIDAFDWRTAFVLFALLWSVPATTLALLFFHDRRPHHTVQQNSSAPAVPLSKSFRSGNFIKLALAVIATQVALAAYMIHLAPALVDMGLSLTQSAAVAGVAGLAAVPGKLGIGYLFDRVGQAWVSLGTMALLALASTVLAIGTTNLGGAALASSLLGLSAGAMMAFIACLCRRLFAPAIFGTIYGAMISLSALSGAVGPLVASLIHDARGSYTLAFWLGLVIALVAVVLLISLKRPDEC